MVIEGNKLNCASGESGAPKEPKEPKKLVRIGPSYFSKDTHTERKLNFGVRVEKAPGGVVFKSLNEVVVDKQAVYNPVNKKVPTYPGEEVQTSPPLVGELPTITWI